MEVANEMDKVSLKLEGRYADVTFDFRPLSDLLCYEEKWIKKSYFCAFFRHFQVTLIVYCLFND